MTIFFLSSSVRQNTDHDHQEEQSTTPETMKTNLRKIRFEHGELSQQQLADLVGVSRQTIVSIEHGDYAPSVKLALIIAEQLNVTIEQLFTLETKDYT